MYSLADRLIPKCWCVIATTSDEEHTMYIKTSWKERRVGDSSGWAAKKREGFRRERKRQSTHERRRAMYIYQSELKPAKDTLLVLNLCALAFIPVHLYT